MMSPKQISEDRGPPHPASFRHTPLQIIHVIGNFMRIWSVYSMYRYLSQTGASVVLFIFSCLVPSSILFLALQKPWKGRPLSNAQVVPSVINGGITALYFILWGKGLKSCGPVRAIMGEYSGAVLGVLSAVLYGRRGHVWKKVGGLIAMLASFYFLSQGWAMATYSPFYILLFIELVSYLTNSKLTGLVVYCLYFFFKIFIFKFQVPTISWFPPFFKIFIVNNYHIFACDDELNQKTPLKDSLDTEIQTERVLGMTDMAIPILAGILSALRRVIARRVSLKNQLKRRLHAITIASATCFLFPVAMWDMIIGSTSDSSINLSFSMWAYLSTILFGVILIFYVDSIAEERLHMVFSSPRHLMVAGGCIIVMEVVYKMDFSLPGFLICSTILGFGIYEATSLEHNRKDSFQNPDLSNGILEDPLQMSSLPT
ncbi:hypothetical protein L1049_002745 [Liquidambar formosana]|uniref:Zinc transporter 5 n=1 Tax=Liquidambar formosana TaxID=63359 RepID=A0AAP0NKV5_LIQFO